MRRRRAAWWLGGLAAAATAAAVGLAAALRRARLEPMLVRGDSMRPTLVPGQRIAVGPLREPPRRGEVVVLRRPDRWQLEVVKRVVGLPGERVRLVGGRLEVDGREVPEPYLAAAIAPRRGRSGPPAAVDVLLGEGEYLVLGDHRDASSDGRDFGPVRAADLVGSVRFAYWPPRRMRPRE
ncbi:MAG TPA: signal peptidase I [Actinomycetes bacterium]|nr:signal peptidase I [Actinomycetes bacterium]